MAWGLFVDELISKPHHVDIDMLNQCPKNRVNIYHVTLSYSQGLRGYHRKLFCKELFALAVGSISEDIREGI
jgi:hypothetical protein